MAFHKNNFPVYCFYRLKVQSRTHGTKLSLPTIAKRDGSRCTCTTDDSYSKTVTDSLRFHWIMMLFARSISTATITNRERLIIKVWRNGVTHRYTVRWKIVILMAKSISRNLLLFIFLHGQRMGNLGLIISYSWFCLMCHSLHNFYQP